MEYFNVLHCRFPSFICDLLKILSYLLMSEKVMFAQFDSNFSIHFISSPGNSAINLLLFTSIFACKIFLMAFFENSLTFPLLFLYNLEVLHKFLCTVEKLHFHWFYKCDKINPGLERIFIQFELDDFLFICFRQKLFG